MVTTPVHSEKLKDVAVTLNPHNVHPEPVSDLLYSGFLEHLGRVIYGGIVDDEKHPSPKDLLVPGPNGSPGWRKDVIEVIKGLEMPMIRWPGGNYVSNYHWQDGVGAIENRPVRMDLAWGGDESNKFGTNEFIDYCREIKCEPYICLNMGSGTLEEALAWLEYCNGKGNTYWANLRRKHTGRHEPHGIKYWGLGNEMWGSWQVGNLSAKDYAEKARQWAHAMRLIDPSIKLVSCGQEGNSEWDSTVLKALIGSVDMHSIHFYSALNYETNPEVKGLEYEANVFGPAAAERSIEVCKSLIDSVTIDHLMKTEAGTGKFLPYREIKIAFDEWNVWDQLKGNSTTGLEQHYDFTDVLGFVAWLNLLVRQHKNLGLACLAQTVNAIAPILTDKDRVLRQSIFYPLDLFSRLMKNGHVLNISATSDLYSGPTHPRWIQKVAPPSYVDVVAMFFPDTETIRLSVLNRHPDAEARVDLRFDGLKVKSGKMHEMYSDDLKALNTFERPDTVKPTVKEWSGEVLVRKHSWQFIELQC